MIFIDNILDLERDIQSYKEMFPETYRDYDFIKNVAERHYNDPVGFVFGVEVSSAWQDKCYGFEVEKVTPEHTYIRYIGVWKC